MLSSSRVRLSFALYLLLFLLLSDSVFRPAAAEVPLSSECHVCHGTVKFTTTTFTVNENAVTALIQIMRTNGDPNNPRGVATRTLQVTLTTEDGSAIAGTDYRPLNKTIKLPFTPNNSDGTRGTSVVTERVEIINDTSFEGNKTVTLRLKDPMVLNQAETSATAADNPNNLNSHVLAFPSVAGLTIVDDDVPFNYSLSNSGNISLKQGGSRSNTITRTLLSGSTQAVTLTPSGLPSGATLQGNSSCSPTCSNTFTISTTGAVPLGTYPITLTGTPLGKTTSFNLFVNAASSIAFDFDGDGKSDVGVYRNGAWAIRRSSDLEMTNAGWGGVSWEPVVADYDGDGKADIAVYNPIGVWSIVDSSNNANTVKGWGGPGWIPVPADYDGDGRADIAVYNPIGLWSIVNSSNNTNTVKGWGGPAWTPVPANYDGDGKTDIAVYNPIGVWSIVRSSDSGNMVVGWGGGLDDIPLPAQ